MKKICFILLFLIMTRISLSVSRHELKITKDFNSNSFIGFYEPDTSSNFKKEYGVGFEVGNLNYMQEEI